MYRIITIPGVVKISTITSPFNGLSEVLLKDEIKAALSQLEWTKVRFKRNARLLQSVTSGPNWPISGLGGILDAIAFHKYYPELLIELENVCKVTGEELWKLLQQELQHIDSFLARVEASEHSEFWQDKLADLKLCKLSPKQEAAGKIRIFAIMDLWSQSALRPLHDYLSEILKIIPQDGTFDQLAPINKLLSTGVKTIYSFDLTAATDRLPLKLQTQVIALLLGEKFANSWAKLLVGRPAVFEGVPYYYSVGQPMGAYSSWASMALTHHLIIQIAARRAGWTTWFHLYAVLGDDVVIADKAVALIYLSLMRDLGVAINPDKSLESELGLAEFAKRLLGPLGDISPISPKLVLQTALRPAALTEVVRDMINRGVSVQTSDLQRFIQAFPKKLGEEFIWNITGPVGFLNLLGLSPFLGNRSLNEVQLQRVAEAVDQVVNSQLISNHYRGIQESYEVWAKLENSISQYYTELKTYPSGLQQVVRHLKADWRALIKQFQVVNPNLFDAPSTLQDVFVGLPSTVYQLTQLERHLRKKEKSRVPLRDHWVLLSSRGYTNQTVYDYMVESFNIIDGANAGIPDLITKVRPSRSLSNRLKIYKQLETVMVQDGIDTFLSIRSLPDLDPSESDDK
jgi:phage FluMu protein gp41